ncbi:hypothetical protein NE865_09668 [Phthorimaea operculella]|nr:hypothetical protein NE865_09668 [Phthorimaea operculella]
MLADIKMVESIEENLSLKQRETCVLFRSYLRTYLVLRFHIYSEKLPVLDKQMNIILYIISLLELSVALSEAFFLMKVHTEPSPLFCIKVCPLYCHPKTRRRRDIGPPEHYHFDAEDEPWPDVTDDIDWHSIPLDHYSHHSPYYFCQPHPTTNKPTTTTEEPTFICQLCKQKCNYPKS